MTTLFNHLSRALHAWPGQRKSGSEPDMAKAAAMKTQLDHLCRELGRRADRSIIGQRASLVTGDAIAIAPPTLDEGVDFAQLCLRRDVRRVVDLRSGTEKARAPAGPLDGPVKRTGGDSLVASFERQGRKAALQTVGAGSAASDAHASRVEVRLARDGTALGPDGSASPGHAQVLELIRMPTRGADGPICPRRLFDVSLHLALTRRPGGVTVFQSADGGRTGATFAAASKLLQRFLSGAVEAHRMDEAVVMECLRLSPGPSHPFRTEDLAALAGFARLMLEADARGELPARATSTRPQKPPRALEHSLQARPTVTRELEPPPVVVLPSPPGQSPDAPREPPPAKGSILKSERTRPFKEIEVGGEDREARVAFGKELRVRYDVDEVDEVSGDYVSRETTDFRRRLTEGSVTVPRRVGREENGEEAAFPDADGHEQRWQKPRKPKRR